MSTAELNSAVFCERSEKGSTILTSNLVFSKWTQVFAGDKVVTTAILDRLLHHSHIINIQGDSYRLKEKKESGIINSDLYKFGAKSSNKIRQN
ncbi:ATP-binding protein [Sulfurimonas indica]|uniref:ATP-binding protein n=1 Tax=Sulfurimonas TaxID=202746 RepID=UPI003CCD0A40